MKARPGPTVPATPLIVDERGTRPRSEHLATEEPLEIRVIHRGSDVPVAVTMRTPGNDFELAVGFLYGEGMLRPGDVREVSYCASGPPEQVYNVVSVELSAGAPFDAEAMRRNFYTTSSCGVCGKASLEAVAAREGPPMPAGPVLDSQTLLALPGRLLAKQKVFARTGGLHAAGLFDAEGNLLEVREDVGRHNAVDKIVGRLVLDGTLPAGERVLQVSGRASFEIMQKALAAGIPFVSAVSAPSSLAVDIAESFGMTLAGFVRQESFNIYAGASRIRSAAARSSGESTSSSA
jgi:FdhD protein